MKKINWPNIFKIISIIAVAGCIVFFIGILRTGIFSSQEELQAFISRFGAAGPLVFVVFQVLQVIIPLLPVGIGYFAGVFLFGSLAGFIYSYIGISLGSFLAFFIGRYFGRKLIKKLFDPQQVEKYDQWTSKKNRFLKLFALAIVMPVAPDDLLCYLAGTTNITFPLFAAIILLGKPLTIALYSFGLMTILNNLPAWIVD